MNCEDSLSAANDTEMVKNSLQSLLSYLKVKVGVGQLIDDSVLEILFSVVEGMRHLTISAIIFHFSFKPLLPYNNFKL